MVNVPLLCLNHSPHSETVRGRTLSDGLLKSRYTPRSHHWTVLIDCPSTPLTYPCKCKITKVVGSSGSNL